MLVAILLVTRRVARQGWDTEIPLDLFLVGTLGGVVLTRIFFVVTYPQPFLAEPWRVFRVWEGGITYYGGLLGTYLSGWTYCWYWRLPLGETADLFSPFLALGHGIGRVGCFLQGCCYGVPTSGSWGFVFPTDPEGLHRHPAQLYESGLEVANAVLLNWLWHRGHRGGRVTLTWFSLYALERFLLEFVRGDTQIERAALGLSFGQLTALGMAVACLLWARRLQPTTPEELDRFRPPEDAG
jgi:phosphatidylglycerol:prolipoprotein diacylglycerol transferase